MLILVHDREERVKERSHGLLAGALTIQLSFLRGEEWVADRENERCIAARQYLLARDASLAAIVNPPVVEVEPPPVVIPPAPGTPEEFARLRLAGMPPAGKIVTSPVVEAEVVVPASAALLDADTGELVPRELGALVVYQRAKDGYVNATAMCKAAGKLMATGARTLKIRRFCRRWGGLLEFQ